MCRVEERVYVSADGHRSKFEDTFPCDKASRGRLCANVKKRTTEYYPKKNVISRHDTPSPVNPPTPTGTSTYLVQKRRPSSSSGRPSTGDKTKAFKPELIIEFGSKNDKSKKYPSISLSSTASKRISIGSGSIDDVAVESPGSDASHTIRTGYPEAALPPSATPYGHSDGYNTTPTFSRGHGYHHRHNSSTSSYTGSSRTPSLYVTSDPDYDSPTNTREARVTIHNPSTTGAPSSPSRARGHTSTGSGGYNITVMAPRNSAQDAHTSEGLFATDYPADRSASSKASSGASSKSRRVREPEQPRRKKDEERRQNVKQVRFELGRAESRAKERAETQYAEHEKQRALDREEARRQKQVRDDEAARERKKKETRVPASNSSTKRPSQSRRSSKTYTPAEAEEIQRRLLAADLGQMHGESLAAQARETQERRAELIQQQQDTSYYNPRTGGMSSNATSLTHRDSVTRRGSVSSADPRPVLGRSNSSSRRTSVVQPNPPQINTQVQQGYTRPPSARTHAPPPVSFPSNFNTRPPSARRPSFSAQENPFAAPPTRGSGSSISAPHVASPSVTVHQDPWDARTMREALPTTRQTSDGRYTMERRGTGTHSAAQEATRAMGRAAGYAHEEYVTDSDDEPTHGHARRKYP
ncbi:hypothetical protein EK21DRAFT_67159 [Setomelanomma holmii]|uniref:Uncharacterized protein n=1 Tax=Setomelanomma holmii TaxID=210430 RepID=A0A9P4H8Z2_9PLEO|nr:hypothetical protein EK21DRAFT_67159 [Setomelanomma holmii]